MLALTKDSRAVQEQRFCFGGFCVRLIVASRDEHDFRSLTKLPRSEQFNQTTRSLKPLGTSDGKFQHVPFFEVETWWHWRDLRAATQKGCWSLHAHIILAVLFVLGLGEQKKRARHGASTKRECTCLCDTGGTTRGREEHAICDEYASKCEDGGKRCAAVVRILMGSKATRPLVWESGRGKAWELSKTGRLRRGTHVTTGPNMGLRVRGRMLPACMRKRGRAGRERGVLELGHS
jgi:hypothetical protein